MSRLGEFVQINRARDLDKAHLFWDRLAIDWLKASNQPAEDVELLQEASEELGFGPNSILFHLYADVIPCLDWLDRSGIRAGVVSNWDYSLHRVLKMFGIYDRFVVVKASLEEGVEKPDPRLFEIALAEAGFSSCETFHVGDSPEDDLEGATAAGIRAALIDRTAGDGKPFTIRSLSELPEAFAWIV